MAFPVGFMLTVVCAHRAEAEPLIRDRALRRTEDAGNLFAGEGIRLIVTGQGPDQCGRTLDRVGHRWLPGESDTWVNFGVAGYGPGAVDDAGNGIVPGCLVAVARVKDRSGTWVIDPARLSRDQGTALGLRWGGVLRTVSAPETRFAQPVLYDMEGARIAGFLQANRCLTRLVVIKLVVDGPGVPASRRLNAARRLLALHSAEIAGLGAMLEGTMHREHPT